MITYAGYPEVFPSTIALWELSPMNSPQYSYSPDNYSWMIPLDNAPRKNVAYEIPQDNYHQTITPE